MHQCSRVIRSFASLALLAGLVAACAGLPQENGAAAAAMAAEKAAQSEADRAQASRIAALQLELVVMAADNQRLLQAIEQGRKQLDEAMLEVVRSKAKLGSLGSRAEAATALAESESLAKTLQSRSASIPQESEYRAAERMLALGNQEFKNGNFGGAYYLASNARTGFAVLVTRSATAVPPALADRPESRFAAPIDLVFSTRGTVRENPNTDARVIRVADKGTEVTGLAARDLWILVEFRDGSSGWAFYDLVAAP
ncbi:MAG TPA: SH3 domain-containing protein [Rhodocyclaceae bacterium]